MYENRKENVRPMEVVEKGKEGGSSLGEKSGDVQKADPQQIRSTLEEYEDVIKMLKANDVGLF